VAGDVMSKLTREEQETIILYYNKAGADVYTCDKRRLISIRPPEILTDEQRQEMHETACWRSLKIR
jgi:hypothetical protein